MPLENTDALNNSRENRHSFEQDFDQLQEK